MIAFDRDQWAALGAEGGDDHPPVVVDGDVPKDEVEAVYLPLARLLWQWATAHREETGPFMVGLAGGVAVGKSTSAHLLQALLRAHGPVEVVTTDCFLHPNRVLEERGLAGRKGFPESYDHRRLLAALSAIRRGAAEVTVPVYTHLTYDIVAGASQVVRRAAVVIVEGLNVLQWPSLLDVSVYVDADEADMARWFGDRVLRLRAQAADRPDAYFHRFAGLTEHDLSALAAQVWTDVNLVNLRQNVAPTRPRADVVLEKGADQRVRRILVRGT